MKTWVIVRHAKSSWSNSELEDIERPLNKRGRRDAPFMAKLLHGKGIVPDILISSPAVRAHTTAEYFASECKKDLSTIAIEERIYEAYPEDLVELAHQFNDYWDTVFLFGHNPTLTDLVNRYTEDHIDNIPTCGVAILEAKVDHWTELSSANTRLVEFFYPKQYFS